MNTLKLLELNKQLVLNIENLVNMAHNHSRSTDSIIDEIVETITKRGQALQLQQTGVMQRNCNSFGCVDPDNSGQCIYCGKILDND